MLFHHSNYLLNNKFLHYIYNIMLYFAILGLSFQWLGTEVLLYRVFLVIFLVFGLFNVKKILGDNKENIRRVLSNKYILFFVLWEGYAILSLLWVKDTTLAFKDIYYIFIGVFFIIVTQFITNYKFGIKNYINIISICTIGLVALGMFEHITGYHLSQSMYYNIDRIQYRYRPTGVFVNPNNYALFITMFIWVLYYQFLTVSKTYQKLFYLFVFLCGVYLLQITSSRACIISFVVQLICFLIFYTFEGFSFKKLKKRYWLKIFMVVLCFMVFLFVTYISDFGFNNDRIFHVTKWPSYFQEKLHNQINQPAPEEILDMDEPINSTGVRINLIKNALIMLKDSHLRGVGAGNLEWLMKEYHRIYYPTGNILRVHNWWIEVLTDYGVVIFLLYLTVLVSMGIDLIKAFIKALHKKDIQEMHLSRILIIILVGFPLASISPSSIMDMRYVWIMFAFILYFLSKHHND